MAFRRLNTLLDKSFGTKSLSESISSQSLSSQASISSNGPPKPKTLKINSSMDLKTFQSEGTSKSETPLAIMLSWLGAKERHLEHYRKLYYAHGFDVLTVKVTPTQLLIPKRGTQVIAENVLNFMKENMEYNKFVIHTFSVGAYLFGEMLVKMKKKRESFSTLQDKIAALIMDSPVDVQGTPEGLARSISSNPFIIKTLESSINSYLGLFYNVSTKHYYKASKAFYENDLKCPSLWFCSKDDFVGNCVNAEKAAKKWAETGSEVTFKIWESSNHVNHFNNHRAEYSEAVDSMLNKIGFQGITSDESVPEKLYLKN